MLSAAVAPCAWSCASLCPLFVAVEGIECELGWACRANSCQQACMHQLLPQQLHGCLHPPPLQVSLPANPFFSRISVGAILTWCICRGLQSEMRCLRICQHVQDTLGVSFFTVFHPGPNRAAGPCLQQRHRLAGSPGITNPALQLICLDDQLVCWSMVDEDTRGLGGRHLMAAGDEQQCPMLTTAGAWGPGLKTLRLGLSGVRSLALALPQLRVLDLNGAGNLRCLELHCPLLLTAFFKACRYASPWLPYHT